MFSFGGKRKAEKKRLALRGKSFCLPQACKDAPLVSGQQDTSAAQGTKRMLGAATRKTRSAFKIVPVTHFCLFA